MLTIISDQYPARVICIYTTPSGYILYISTITLRNDTQLLLNRLAVDEAIDNASLAGTLAQLS